MNTADVACVLHGDVYDWQYVENLYNMITVNSNKKINFHVLTESSRNVPGYMIKHNLTEWPNIAGAKKGWWYKMQLFAPGQFNTPVTYFDLDTVIVDNIDNLLDLSDRYFWAVLDFKYLWRGSWKGINSSIMRWNPLRTRYIWQDFVKHNISVLLKKHHGDQDYLTSVLNSSELRYIDTDVVKSWRWQVLDGGLNTKNRKYNSPGSGTMLDPKTRVLIFHGNPKPHEVSDPVVLKHWARNHK